MKEQKGENTYCPARTDIKLANTFGKYW